MHLDLVADHKFHAREANTVGRNPPPAEGCCRVCEVEHDLSSGCRDVLKIELFHFKIGGSLVNETFIALGTGHSDFLFVMKNARRIAGPDDGGQAELAADDGRMRGASAMIRDDRRSPLHNRDPVGVSRLGHENRAVDEAADTRGYRSGKHARIRRHPQC